MFYVVRMRFLSDSCAMCSTLRYCVCRNRHNNVTVARLGHHCSLQMFLKIFFSSFAGVHFPDTLVHDLLTASTDAGNVSHQLPTIHPLFALNTTMCPHTVEFQKTSGTQDAYKRALVVGKSLALTCLEVMRDTQLLETIKDEFRASKGKQ